MRCDVTISLCCWELLGHMHTCHVFQPDQLWAAGLWPQTESGSGWWVASPHPSRSEGCIAISHRISWCWGPLLALHWIIAVMCRKWERECTFLITSTGSPEVSDPWLHSHLCHRKGWCFCSHLGLSSLFGFQAPQGSVLLHVCTVPCLIESWSKVKPAGTPVYYILTNFIRGCNQIPLSGKKKSPREE